LPQACERKSHEKQKNVFFSRFFLIFFSFFSLSLSLDAVAIAAAQTNTTTAAAATAVPCTAEQTKTNEACTATATKCIADAAADNAKKCACFKVKCGSTCGVLPSPTLSAEDKKKAAEACVTFTGCTLAECEALAASSSSLVASFSVLAAVIASRLF
jgi:hypothetical protein